MTRSLVIGGGFLGSHVAQNLAARGDHVVIYSRSFSDSLLEEGRPALGAIELMRGTVPPGTGLQEVIAECEVIYYLAGSGTPLAARNDPGGSIVRTVVPAAAVLDLMRETSTRRIVLASSGGTVYGQARRLPTDEMQPTRPINIHGHNSLSVERYALFYAEHYDLDPVILRYSNPYGPGQWVKRGQGVIAAWCQAVAQGKRIVVYGSLDARRDFVYISDAAEAALAAGSNPGTSGIFNVGSQTSHTLAEVLDLIQKAAGRTVEVEHIAARGVDVLATQLDCTRLRTSTGWKPEVDLKEGIEKTLKWMTHVASAPHP